MYVAINFRNPNMRRCAITVFAFAVLGCRTVATAEEDTPKRSPELQVLNSFVGTWDIKTTVKPAGQEPVTIDNVSYRQWSKGGKFVLFDDPGTQEELHLPITFYPKSGKYRGVIISGTNGEFTGVVTGTWDKDTKTMHFLIENTNKTTYRGAHRFVRDGYAEVSGKITNESGDVLMELTFRQIRRTK